MPLRDTSDPAIQVTMDSPEMLAIGMDSRENVVHYAQRNMTQHTLRNVIVGLFLRLDEHERQDLVELLGHCHEPLCHVPGMAQAIAWAGRRNDQPPDNAR